MSLIATLAWVVLATAGANAHAAGCQGANLLPSAHNLARVQTATLCLVNAQRRKHGERPLIPALPLAATAAAHSRDMTRRLYFSHVSPDGQTPLDRIRASGFLRRPNHGYTIGENIGWGTTALATPRAIVRAWMRSPGHRANILDRAFRYTGIGVAPSPPVALLRYQPAATYTQDFVALRP